MKAIVKRVLFAVCPVRARQDSPGKGRGGVVRKQLQLSHCIIRGLTTGFGLSPLAQQLLESSRFYSLLLCMFSFLALAFLSFAVLPRYMGRSTQLSFLKSSREDCSLRNHLSQQLQCRHVQIA